MHLVFHVGAHATDDERLIRTLAANSEAMAQAEAHAPAPGVYRTALRDTLIALRGRPADAATQEALRKACLRGIETPVERLVFSYENFLALPNRVIGASGLYPAAAEKLPPLANLFPQARTEFFLGLLNPAVLIGALLARQNGRSYEEMMEGHAPQALRWGPVVARMAQAAQQAGASLVVWCNEDLPLILPEVLRAMSGVAETTPLAGEMALVEDLMDPEGARRLRAYLAQHPPQTAEQRRKVVIAFMEQFARPEAMATDLPLPGWTDETVEEITALYEEDVAQIAGMASVRLITP